MKMGLADDPKMTDKETQAVECMRIKQWTQAINILDQVLNSSFVYQYPKDMVLRCLTRRSDCNTELGNLEQAVQDCRRVVKLTRLNERGGARARYRLVRLLFRLERFHEAERACCEWLDSADGPLEATKALARLCASLQVANGQKNKKISQQYLEEEITVFNDTLKWWVTSINSAESYPVQTDSENNANNCVIENHNSQMSNDRQEECSQQEEGAEEMACLPCDLLEVEAVCSYCALTFPDRVALRAHCQTSQHQTIIMSDEGHNWHWRPPPRGYTSESYGLCESFASAGYCRYGAQCVEAHGPEELSEWKERFEYRKLKMQKASENELYGKSYTEQLLERWIQSPSPDKVMKEKIEGIEETCSAALVTTVSSKVSKRDWSFIIRTKKRLKAVALLQDAHRTHFVLKQVIPGVPKAYRKGHGHKVPEADLPSDQEWTAPINEKEHTTNHIYEHKIKVAFTTDIYGTFRQSVIFDFGVEPALVRHLCVDVVPVGDADKIKEICKEMTLSTVERWDSINSDIVPFASPVYPGLATPHAPGEGQRETALLGAYPAPRADTFALTQGTVVEKKLTQESYKSRMHELLYVEELARLEQVARFNVSCQLHIAPSYLLAPSGMAASTAKYAHSGELFALLTLGKDISEDTSAGRLILNNCTTVLISSRRPATEEGDRRVYEALIEDKGKNTVYLRVPSIAVSELGLVADSDYDAEVQFQLNRLTFCEWHYAVDKLAELSLVFPALQPEPNIPWTPHVQWSDALDTRLNSKQKEAVLAITAPKSILLPPILLIGPFGTGKTYTLAQAIKQLLLQSDTRILICTHSNSAADLYIKDYLHPWLEAGLQEAKPLRIYYHKRWVATVNQTVQKYCLIDTDPNMRSFRLPVLEDILAHRIVVVTLSISMYLSTLGLPKGHFTHILLDEAAQAMETEALMPLALADARSRVVLAGDHMQLSPELFSQFAIQRHLHISLLERLYDHYPPNFPCKILLCENYRAHEAIVNFTSELFYEQKLVSSGRQPRHDKFYPLTFFTTRGEDVQDLNSTAFYNNSEVYEVVERVCELRRKWPSAWGRLDDQSIGIMTPYADQVFRIRSELRKRRMGGISVERVLNVQGKQFRAIFLSTVRTRRTCASQNADYGFLSNRKLLNTAITRAQSLVAVVGDPVALCSVGRCRKLWERFIRLCHDNESLFGISYVLLRSQLDGLELKKTYSLNPLAPEFIPRALQTEAYIKMRVPEIPVIAQMPVAAMLPSFRPLRPAIPPVLSYPLYFPPYPPPPPAANFTPTAPLVQPPPQSFAACPSAQWNVSNYNVPLTERAPNWSLQNIPKRSDISTLSAITSNGSNLGAAHSMSTNTLSNVYRQSAPSGGNLDSPSSSRGSMPEDALSPFLRAQLSRPPPALEMTDHARAERDHIQFLQNVHFPEKPVQPVFTSRKMTTTARPPMSNAAVAAAAAVREEAREAQQLWYRHLLNTQGVDSARRFLELVACPPPPPSIPENFTAEEFASNINEMFSDKRPVQTNRRVYNAEEPQHVLNGHSHGHGSGVEERRWGGLRSPFASDGDAFRMASEPGAAFAEAAAALDAAAREAAAREAAVARARADAEASRSVPLYRRRGRETDEGSSAEQWGELLRTYASVLRDDHAQGPPLPMPNLPVPDHTLYQYFK